MLAIENRQGEDSSASRCEYHQATRSVPLRLLLPGWEGNANIKWLHVLKVTDKPYQTREETAKYTDFVCHNGECHARQFTFVGDDDRQKRKTAQELPRLQHEIATPCRDRALTIDQWCLGRDRAPMELAPVLPRGDMSHLTGQRLTSILWKRMCPCRAL
jgi:DMSO/TMAO reductase YedYZ molybdopterin-dependent catalytic subunit